MKGIYRLSGVVKHYDWGGTSFIPALLKRVNKDNIPFAEYWMGSHPQAISTLDTDTGLQPLNEYCENLSFLFKVLDVKKMLSIQVHPSKKAAEIEFERENAEGISLNSPSRNYKDKNHKPELMVALSDFWLLHGFKPPEELIYTLLNVVELRELLPVYNQSGYAGLYKYVMEMPQTEVNRILNPLVYNLATIYSDKEPNKNDEDFWAARAAATFTVDNNIDRGIFSIYLFNLVHLKKGEGIFQDAGVPHAYLEGQNVEIMASSDNVIRGGLTSKHIDVKELLKHVKCEATYPKILTGYSISEPEKQFITPAVDFHLNLLEMDEGSSYSFTTRCGEILLLTDGAVELKSDNAAIFLEQGHPAAFACASEKINIKANKKSWLFRASGGDTSP
jgi:mannose-6-phosphate isomerase